MGNNARHGQRKGAGAIAVGGRRQNEIARAGPRKSLERPENARNDRCGADNGSRSRAGDLYR